jgi:HAE1 family hydrophobic/amphiphilic exporter-1
VLVQGAGAYAMRQWVKPDQLASLGVTVPDLVKALEQQNTVNPSGQVGAEPAPPGQEFTYTMRAQGRLVTEQDFGDVVIRENKDGSVVRMKDVARIELGTQTYNVIGRLNDAPAAIINVFQLPGLQRRRGRRWRPENDGAVERTSFRTMWITWFLSTPRFPCAKASRKSSPRYGKRCSGDLCRFHFPAELQSHLIPALTVPVSLLGTFIFFPMLGFSINSLSFSDSSWQSAWWWTMRLSWWKRWN